MKKRAQKIAEKRNKYSKIYYPLNKKKTIYLGADISVNHCALVTLKTESFEIKETAITTFAEPAKSYSNIFKIVEDVNNPNLGPKLNRALSTRLLYQKMLDYLFLKTDLSKYDINVYIEGYAYGAKGALFDIAEMTQTFKLFLNDYFKSKINLYTITPNTLKKFITGKHNAKKDLMRESILSKYNVDFTHYDCLLKGSDISEDMCDAFSLAKFGYEFDLWQLDNKINNKYFGKLKEETILGFRR